MKFILKWFRETAWGILTEEGSFLLTEDNKYLVQEECLGY
jgi:hypothetical protein